MWPHGSPLAVCSLLTVMAVSLLPIHCSHIFPNLTSDIWHRPECHHRSRTGWLSTELCEMWLQVARWQNIWNPQTWLFHSTWTQPLLQRAVGRLQRNDGIGGFCFQISAPRGRRFTPKGLAGGWASRVKNVPARLPTANFNNRRMKNEKFEHVKFPTQSRVLELYWKLKLFRFKIHQNYFNLYENKFCGNTSNPGLTLFLK